MTDFDFSVGQLVAPISRGPITLDMLKRYASASGDHNPIHVDELAAEKAGLPGIIAHGMLTAGYLTDAAVRFIEQSKESWQEEWRLISFQCRFKALVRLGDTVLISGIVKSVTENSMGLDFTSVNQKGEVTAHAQAKFGLVNTDGRISPTSR